MGNIFDDYRNINPKNESREVWCHWPANYKMKGKNWEREAVIQCFDINHKLVIDENVGIRVRGNASRAFPCKSFNIYARELYGVNRFKYDFWGTNYYPATFSLFACGGDTYSKIRDSLTTDLCKNLDFATQHYTPCEIFLDGEYWGVYYITEKYDAEYFSNYYGVEKDNVVVIRTGEVEEGTEEDQVAFLRDMDYLMNADLTNSDNYAKACEIIDMQSTIDYFAASIYLGKSKDWLVAWTNTGLWKTNYHGATRYEDGKWRWIMFDSNGTAWKDSASLDNLGYHLEHSMLLQNLCTNDSFRKAFIERIFEFGGAQSEDIIDPMIEDYKELLSEPMNLDLHRYYNGSNDLFFDELRYIEDYFDERYDRITKLCDRAFPNDNVVYYAQKYSKIQ